MLQVASNAMFAATLLGVAVLIAEFASKMKAVNGITVRTTNMPLTLIDLRYQNN